MKRIDELLRRQLLEGGHIKETDIDRHPVSDFGFVRFVLEENLVPIEKLANILKTNYNIDFCDLIEWNIEDGLVTTFGQAILRSSLFFPLKKTETEIYIATADPFDTNMLGDIRILIGCKVTAFFCDPRQIDFYIDKFFNAEVKSAPSIIELVNSLLESAIIQNASDIHIEPALDDVRIRFRVDGILKHHQKLDKIIFENIVSRLKVMAELDITSTRLPSDGNIKEEYKPSRKEVDFRLSTVPTIFGEKIVIRLIYKQGLIFNLNLLGFFKEDADLIRDILSGKSEGGGAILVTGPTGSGKTTTLASFITYLNNDHVNIVTIEDPVENIVKGVNHVDISLKTDMNFNNALRHILRQDPDIIMIGEVRDNETAAIVTRAAITGHLVLSTLHTNDGLNTIARLLDMEVPTYLVSAAIRCIISQRLVRKLCEHCKAEVEIPKYLAEKTNVPQTTTIYEAKGCQKCFGTGYKGRFAIYEILTMTSKLKSLIDSRESFEKIRENLLKNGQQTLEDNALQNLLVGNTSLKEIHNLIMR